MNNQKLLRRSYQKKFDSFKKTVMDRPPQGWLKTIREFFGMTTEQLAKKINVSQSRVVNLEKNEKNTKISTMERIADALDCDFVYAIIPRKNIDDILYNQAKKRALAILNKININMGLENQLSENKYSLEDLTEELLNKNIARIWDEE